MLSNASTGQVQCSRSMGRAVSTAMEPAASSTVSIGEDSVRSTAETRPWWRGAPASSSTPSIVLCLWFTAIYRRGGIAHHWLMYRGAKLRVHGGTGGRLGGSAGRG